MEEEAINNILKSFLMGLASGNKKNSLTHSFIYTHSHYYYHSIWHRRDIVISDF